MKNALKITIPLAFLVAAGIGTYTIISRLSDSTLAMLLGGLLVLVVVFVVGTLFVLKDYAQAYILRRAVVEDDKADIKQMLVLGKLLQGGSFTYNVQPSPSALQIPGAVEGTYRDVTDEVKIGD